MAEGVGAETAQTCARSDERGHKRRPPNSAEKVRAVVASAAEAL